MKRLLSLYNLDTEERCIKKLVGFTYILFMLCFVFRIDSVVYGLCRQFGMQLTWFAIKSRTVIVKDTISDIRGLLYLGKFYASADSMNTARREVEHITFVYLMFCEDIRYSATSDSLFILLWCNLYLKPCIEVCSWFSIKDIPHLRFPKLVMLALSHLIIGMYLYGKILMGINDFCEKR